MEAIASETTVRLSVRQVLLITGFLVANTTVVVLFFKDLISTLDKRQTLAEHRLSRLEIESQSFYLQIEKQNQRLDRLVEAINALSVNVARLNR